MNLHELSPIRDKDNRTFLRFKDVLDTLPNKDVELLYVKDNLILKSQDFISYYRTFGISVDFGCINCKILVSLLFSVIEDGRNFIGIIDGKGIPSHISEIINKNIVMISVSSNKIPLSKVVSEIVAGEEESIMKLNNKVTRLSLTYLLEKN